MAIPVYDDDTKYHSTEGELVICYITYRTQLANDYINPLALELDIYSLAHHLCEM